MYKSERRMDQRDYSLRNRFEVNGGLNDTGREIQALSLVFHQFIGMNEMTHEIDLEDP